jgi:hypothetical protein
MVSGIRQRWQAMNDKRAIEHYREHELVCEASPATHGWYYTISVVSHYGDRSEAQTERHVRFSATWKHCMRRQPCAHRRADHGQQSARAPRCFAP